MIINPYNGIDWQTINHVPSLSHAHTRKKTNDGTPGTVYQSWLDNCTNGGAKHIALSNYYKSEPFCPLTDWFETVPDDVFCSPNAEHHNFGFNGWAHINGLGSTLITGQYGGLSPSGMAYDGINTWQAAFKAVLDDLVYDDAGGVTINHPVWSYLSIEAVEAMLDYDIEKILGIEIYNDGESSSMIRDGVNVGWAVNMWDAILSTGRRCWGLAVPDHGTERTAQWTGRNILLLGDNATSYDALKAYRNGNFYTKIYDAEFAFDTISLNGSTVYAGAPDADSMHIVIDGQYYDFMGTQAEMIIPAGATYCRFEAWMDYAWTDENGATKAVTEKLFSNPIMFRQYNPESYQYNYEEIQRVFDL